MECESGCHEGKKSSSVQRPLQHWTEAETKSDSQVESLINVAKFKTTLIKRKNLHQFNGHCNIGLKLKQNQTAKSKV